MPITAMAAFLAALSLAALPPTLGFIGKEMLLEASLSAGDGGLILTIALVLASASSWRRQGSSASGRSSEKAPDPRAHPMKLRRVYGWRPAACPSLALFSRQCLRLWKIRFSGRRSKRSRENPLTLDLALWHGFNLPLALSALSVGSAWPSTLA